MDLLARLAFMLALIGAGIGARRVGLLTERRTAGLNAVTFYVALPALVFTATYDQDPAELASLELLLGMWIAMAATIGLAWLVHRGERTDARRSVAIVQSYHSNFGYIGFPLVTAALGAAASGPAAVVLGIGALTQIPTTTILLVWINGTTADPRREVRRLVTNPVIVTLVIGLAVATVAWTPPATATAGLDRIASASLPLALLCVGASLRVDLGEIDIPRVGSVVALKVLALPVIAVLALTALGADATTTAAVTGMLAAPTAVSSYIYAGELGGDTGLAAANVLATTIIGVATMSGFLSLLV